jgi:hypothetical protein
VLYPLGCEGKTHEARWRSEPRLIERLLDERLRSRVCDLRWLVVRDSVGASQWASQRSVNSRVWGAHRARAWDRMGYNGRR